MNFDSLGIANALDLTDRILPRLQAKPHCRPKLLNFPHYSREELNAIVQDRLTQVCLLGIFLVNWRSTWRALWDNVHPAGRSSNVKSDGLISNPVQSGLIVNNWSGSKLYQSYPKTTEQHPLLFYFFYQRWMLFYQWCFIIQLLARKLNYYTQNIGLSCNWLPVYQLFCVYRDQDDSLYLDESLLLI